MADDWGYKPGGPALSPHIRAQIERRRARFLEAWRRDPAREIALLAVFIVVLVTIFVGSVGLKQYRFLETVGNDSATYWMESAQRFRYVRDIAEGYAIPTLDKRMQAPDGYPPWSDTIFQELLYGNLYLNYAEPGTDIAAFTRLVTRIASTSALLPVVLLCFAVTRRRDAALMGAVAYGTALVVVERGTGQALLREDLAVPLLVWHLSFLALWSLRPKFLTALVSGIFLAGALLCWKVITFYVLILVAFIASAQWLRRARPGVLAVGLLSLVGPSALAALLPYSLQFDRFLSSSSILAALAVLVTLLLGRFMPTVKPWIWAPVSLLIFAALRWGLPVEHGYDHAWETIYARLRFLGAKPADPELLSFHARHYWTGNYQSPTLARLLRDWPPLVLAALPGAVVLSRWCRLASWKTFVESDRVPRPLPTKLIQGLGPLEHLPPLASHFVLWLSLSFVGVYLLFRKLQLFAAIALVLLISLGFAAVRSYRTPCRMALVALLVVGLLQSLAVLPGLETLVEDAPAPSSDPVVVFSADSFNELAGFLSEKTSEDETLLASFVISPFLLTYLDRPTALHCFFEGELPERFRRVTEARFGTEEELWSLARQLGAKWYIHEAHHLLRTDPQMSQRYVAGAIDWPEESVLAQMQFAPDQLEHFELRFENPWFRVFAVLDEGVQATPRRSRETLPLWSRPLFTSMFGDPLSKEGGSSSEPDLVPADLLYATLEAGRHLGAGNASRRSESLSAPWSERYFQEALRVAPYFYPAADALERLYSDLARPDKAAEYRSLAREIRAFLAGHGVAPGDLRPVTRTGASRPSFRFTGEDGSATPRVPANRPPRGGP